MGDLQSRITRWAACEFCAVGNSQTMRRTSSPLHAGPYSPKTKRSPSDPLIMEPQTLVGKNRDTTCNSDLIAISYRVGEIQRTQSERIEEVRQSPSEQGGKINASDA